MSDLAKSHVTAPQRARVRTLFFVQGLSVRQVATLLHISTQRVYQHIAALRRLEPDLEQPVVNEPEEALA